MEEFANQTLFSRAGKSTVHMYPNLYNAPKARKTTKDPPELPGDLVSVLRSEQLLLDAGPISISKPPAPTSSFKVVSRNEYQYAYRNKSGSPSVSRYFPKTNLTSPRIKKTPNFSSSKKSPQKSRVLQPQSTQELNSRIFHQSMIEKPTGTMVKSIHRQVSSSDELELLRTLKESKLYPIPEKVSPKINVVDFQKLKSRDPFIKTPEGPDRLDFSYPETYVLSNNKRPSAIKFDRLSERKYPFKIGLSVGSYDGKREKTLPRLDKLVMSFGKMKGRTSQELKHMLSNPLSPPIEKLHKAFKAQAKDTGKIPSIGSMSGRDDSMYRTKEAYIMNVPEKQNALSPPRFIPNSERLTVYAMAKMGASAYNF